ncbi:MAG: 4-hydroxy-tetrahydrodipicolinate reductase [Gammaproteobacteria bacterium RIFCSPHIGHO2_12_FULL_38_14]|nr:MAG: 4-hydroxy-tetrahydrodipicolinate reductase [Gammaproteobacteria bacterium RIFCSPHIGHO2_12_FULL_38_14]
MIKILLSGANGKMGKTVIASITHEKDLQLVAKTTRGDDLTKAIRQYHPDVVIDFTEPSCAFENTKKIIEAGARAVVGTTGFSDIDIQNIRELCATKKQGVIIAPNFSIGAALMMRYAQETAKYFPDAEIIEYHHPQKKDAPSGTAKKTAAMIAENTENKNIPIHSIRLPGFFADQKVVFGAPGETLVIQHATVDRNAMMPGLFLCCREVMTLDHLVYGIEGFL